MRFIAGLVAGLILGAAVAVSAQAQYWYSGAKMLGQETAFQNGYVAGMYDGFSNARNLLSYGMKINATPATVLGELDRYIACMSKNSDTLGQFKNWAVTQWTNYHDNDKYSAAAVMLSYDCAR